MSDECTPETLDAVFARLLAAIDRGDPGSLAEAKYVIGVESMRHTHAWAALVEAYGDAISGRASR